MKIRICPLIALCLCVSGCVPMAPNPRARSYAPVGWSAQARPDAPQLRRLKNGHYRVTERWTVRLNGRTWRIPKGYTSNGITGPRKIRAAMGDGVQHRETWAAVFHDWLFTQPGVSRAEADRLFYDLLIAYGVDQQKASLMYSSVKAYSLSKSFR